MFVLLPDGSKGTIEDPVSQADVTPTVLDLLGEPRGDDPLFGASVFDEHRTLIPLRRGWFATSAGMVVPDFDFTRPRVFPIGDNPAGDVTKKDWQDSNLMLRIASAYERDLPMRAGAGKTQAVIPTPRARRNLKKPVQSAPASTDPGQ
ncbi:MAG: hypothetical protein HY876_04080 [Coriobacteriales bacterium]|nr:hypothetical protein [Coriobacteriales bacterium]